MAIAIRPATLADKHALFELYAELQPADPSWPTEVAATNTLSGVIEHADATILLCEADGVPVSTCTLFVCPNFTRSGRPFALIENVVTLSNHRKRGYGRQIIRHAIELAHERGCYRVTLMTGSKREETLRFYESTGMLRNTKTAFEIRFRQQQLAPRAYRFDQ
jgi:GNAT superfamily N-acetyltransferase